MKKALVIIVIVLIVLGPAGDRPEPESRAEVANKMMMTAKGGLR